MTRRTPRRQPRDAPIYTESSPKHHRSFPSYLNIGHKIGHYGGQNVTAWVLNRNGEVHVAIGDSGSTSHEKIMGRGDATLFSGRLEHETGRMSIAAHYDYGGQIIEEAHLTESQLNRIIESVEFASGKKVLEVYYYGDVDLEF